jgi:predicted GNAT family acetyltransferase
VELEEHADAAAFLVAAAPVLDADEARHNLVYGICSTLVDAPDAYPEARLWTIRDGSVVGAALMTPPFNIVVARPLDEEALRFAAHALHERSLQPPGVTGAIPEVDVFADAWQELAGVGKRLRMSQGVYGAQTVNVPVGVAGGPRAADLEDHERVVEWLRAFQDEALEEDAPHIDLEAAVERRLKSVANGFVFWEDGSNPVSLCGYGGRTPHGVRIGPVYTPPEHRRRGYGSAVTAHVTKQQLDGGLDYCFLYTDLTNPTSNRIYMQIGYERVCDSKEYSFESN